jgi:hypothetical protein
MIYLSTSEKFIGQVVPPVMTTGAQASLPASGRYILPASREMWTRTIKLGMRSETGSNSRRIPPDTLADREGFLAGRHAPSLLAMTSDIGHWTLD